MVELLPYRDSEADGQSVGPSSKRFTSFPTGYNTVSSENEHSLVRFFFKLAVATACVHPCDTVAHATPP